ncbi:MAG: 16S rRNA (guanine(527)-N(7))-methyltransferase RsmG [bacterium]|nr:16S rRNA (guanine(527)-N(7))-methyltransferase RsmG [bacterium]
MSLRDDAAALFGIALDEGQTAAFDAFARELVAWNAHTNLTAITDADGVRVRHFLDSLSLVRVEPFAPGQTLIDVGTGAGFPGLPLKIAFPALDVTLLEATGKKIAFLQHMVESLGLSGIHTLNARAEEAGQMPAQRAAYDWVVARAVARLPILLEYLLPLAKVGGRCVAMKGKTAHEEVKDSAKALRALGGKLREVLPLALPGIDEAHYLVVIDKAAPTPAEYPRKPGIPAKKPIH